MRQRIWGPLPNGWYSNGRRWSVAMPLRSTTLATRGMDLRGIRLIGYNTNH